MTHRIKNVRILNNMVLSVVFQNGVEKAYDVRLLYPSFPQFRVLEDDSCLFEKVKVDVGGYGIFWNDELDLDAEEIWTEGREVATHTVSVTDALAESLVQVRTRVGMTQKQLAEATGIHQADISKIERGLANPSISTLQRLAEGLQATLIVQIK